MRHDGVRGTIDEALRRAVDGLEVEALAERFRAGGRFLYLPRFLPPELVERMRAEFRAFSPREIHRVFLPFVRKAGTIGQVAIARRAPVTYAIYRSPVLLDFTRRLAGHDLELKHDRDAHAAALYVYQRAGDHVGYHYDDCGCADTASYTGTFGVVNDTRAVVEFHLTEPRVEHRLSMAPGSFVFFCGSRAYHRVTPIARREERVTFSFAYVQPGHRLRGLARFTENIKDAILYFGPRALIQRNY